MAAAAVILAAGKGTRFRSERAKVLHQVVGRTMLRWVLEAVRPCKLDAVVVVVGHQADEVRAEAEAARLAGLVTVTQSEQRGTGHAVRVAVEAGALDGVDTVLVLPGDVPMLGEAVLGRLLDEHGGRAATLLTTRLADPTGYGRVIRDDQGRVARIVEHGDATPDERAVDEVATSIYAFDRERLAAELARLSTDNQQGEEYLTDVIAPLVAGERAAAGGRAAGAAGGRAGGAAGGRAGGAAGGRAGGVPRGQGDGVGAVPAPPEVVAGVNDRAQLAAAGAVLRRRILDRLMIAGVTVVDPAATYVDADAQVAADATLLPGTHLEGGCVVEAGATIGPDSRLVDATVAAGATVTYSVVLGAIVGPRATVGPFTYLRPGTRLARDAKAGAFVEMKNATVGERSKVPHLSYVGDTTIGRGANVGAATVTVNYDGFDKHHTTIGDGARIGSDTMLVAPVTVGEGAYTGAGSVITKDVPDGALAIERSDQRTIEGYAERRARRHAQRTGET